MQQQPDKITKSLIAKDIFEKGVRQENYAPKI